MQRLTVKAEPGAWRPVEPGTDPASLVGGTGEAQRPWHAHVAAHAEYATDTGSTAWLLADEQTGLAAAVGVLAFDGPSAFASDDEAIAYAAQVVPSGDVRPWTSAAVLGDLPAVVVTSGHALPEWLAPAVADAGVEGLGMTQSVLVAPDGRGSVYVAIVSPQLSSTAGFVLAAVAALLESAELDV